MKTKVTAILFFIGAIAPVGLSASITQHQDKIKAAATYAVVQQDPSVSRVVVSPTVAARGPQEMMQDYDAEMIGITQRFSATLAALVDAVRSGKLSREQAQRISAEQYQVAQMQFELLSAWRGMLEQDVTPVPAAESGSAPGRDAETLTVAVPLPAFELSPSLTDYLGLTQPQVEAIQALMREERANLEPLLSELRTTREKLLASRDEGTNDKQVKALAEKEASLIAKVIVANYRTQSKIYNILSAEQQKKFEEFKRTNESPK